MWHLHAFAAKFYQVWFKWQRRLPNTSNLKGSGQIKGQPLRSETCARHLPNPIGLSRAQNFTFSDTRQAQRCTSELHRHRMSQAHPGTPTVTKKDPKEAQSHHEAITKPSRSHHEAPEYHKATSQWNTHTQNCLDRGRLRSFLWSRCKALDSPAPATTNRERWSTALPESAQEIIRTIDRYWVFQHVQTDPMLLSCCSYSIPVSLPSPQKKRCATQCFHCVAAPDPWHPWVDGSVDRTHHRHGWKAPLRFCWIWSSPHGPVCCVSVCLCLLILLRASMVGSSAKKRFGSSALRNSYGQSRRDCCCASVAFLRLYMLTIFKVVCSAVCKNQLPSIVSNSPETTMKRFTLGWDPTTNTSIAKMWSSAVVRYFQFVTVVGFACPGQML